jgi:hypothetical protein
MKYKSKLLYGNDDIFWPFHSFSPEIPDDIISFLSMKMLESGRSSVQTPLVPLRSVRISASKALASPENIQYLPLKWPLRLIISLSPPCLCEITEHHCCLLLPPKPTTPPPPSVRAAPPWPLPPTPASTGCLTAAGHRRCPCPMAAGCTCWGASGHSRPSQGHPWVRPVLVVFARCLSPPAPTSMARINRPRPPLSYIANECFKCFRCFSGMLQIFHMDVAKVDWDVSHVAHVSEVCYKCLFKMFHLF